MKHEAVTRTVGTYHKLRREPDITVSLHDVLCHAMRRRRGTGSGRAS